MGGNSINNCFLMFITAVRNGHCQWLPHMS